MASFYIFNKLTLSRLNVVVVSFLVYDNVCLQRLFCLSHALHISLTCLSQVHYMSLKMFRMSLTCLSHVPRATRGDRQNPAWAPGSTGQRQAWTFRGKWGTRTARWVLGGDLSGVLGGVMGSVLCGVLGGEMGSVLCGVLGGILREIATLLACLTVMQPRTVFKLTEVLIVQAINARS